MTNYPSYPGPPDGTYDPGYDKNTNVDRIHGDGSLNVMDAVKWGFGATFRGWNVWILGTFAFLALAALVGGGTSQSVGNSDTAYGDIIAGICGVVIGTFAINTALRHIDNGRITWGTIGQKIRFWPSLGAYVLVTIITGLIYGAVLFAFGVGLVGSGTSFDDTTPPSEVAAFLLQLFGVFAVATLGQFLIYPFVTFTPFSADDRDGSWWSNVVAGMRVGTQHYGKLLLFFVVYSVCAVALCLITVFLGVLVVLPATVLIEAHIYRQISGGVLPAAK